MNKKKNRNIRFIRFETNIKIYIGKGAGPGIWAIELENLLLFEKIKGLAFLPKSIYGTNEISNK